MYNYLNNLFQQDITQNLNFYEFLNTYKQQDEKLKYIINSKVLTPYNPVQIAISLEKVLKELEEYLDAANEKLAAEQAKLNEISDSIKAKEKE